MTRFSVSFPDVETFTDQTITEVSGVPINGQSGISAQDLVGQNTGFFLDTDVFGGVHLCTTATQNAIRPSITYNGKTVYAIPFDMVMKTEGDKAYPIAAPRPRPKP